MQIEKRLALSMATLAVFGTLLLSMEQRSFLLPLLTLLVAVTSVYFTDIRRCFQLNHTVASIAALAAACVSLYDFLQFNRTEQLLAIANLLVYLQIVLLYQEKNERVYWQLFMTSFLQVVVAAALNLSAVFGLMLMGYMLVALVSLSLFFIYRETYSYRPADANDADTNDADTGDADSPIRITTSEPHNVARHWHPLAMPPVFSRVDTRRRPVRWPLVSSTVSMVITTFVVTVTIFVMVPRSNSNTWIGRTGSATRVVGFDDEVELGQLGEVILNPEVVMRVQFIDEKTGKPFQVVGDPLLRGSIVTTYTRSRNVSRWSQPNWTYQKTNTWNDAEELPRSTGTEPNLVRQRITLEPLDQDIIFCVFPPVALDSEQVVRFDANRQRLIRQLSNTRKQMQIDIGTTGFRGKRQHPITLQTEKLEYHDIHRLLELPETESGDPLLPGLRSAAAEAISRSRAGDADHLLKARALEAFLRNNGGFRYSLRPVDRDPALDPIEDFIVNNQVGHCEYFATALALMLRSQEIPARVVIGYQGGEWNPIGSFYVVRKLHAHTWVEAYLPPEQLARRNVELSKADLHGGWLRLDPTPSEFEFDVATGILASLSQMADYFELLWTNYVIGLNYQKQRRTIYQPLAATATNTTELLKSDSLRIELRVAFQAVAKNFWNWFGGDWFSWRGGLVASGLCFLFFVFYEGARLAWRRMRRWSVLHRYTAHDHTMRVPFFLQFQRVLRRHGITRLPGQTPRELAISVGGQLAESPRSRAAAPLPRHIVDAFYRVRFGGQTLDNQEVKTVEHLLAELNAALTRGSG